LIISIQVISENITGYVKNVIIKEEEVKKQIRKVKILFNIYPVPVLITSEQVTRHPPHPAAIHVRHIINLTQPVI